MTRSGTHAPVSGVTIIVTGAISIFSACTQQSESKYRIFVILLIRTTCSNLKYLY